ncbi:carbamoyltransferase HypF [Flavobacterium hungaricum]|uniref:carbamoyltransferase HypF n=1 Tax=Flavobacterium hungaricum TaxID=2082725 RepID=UPI0018833C67|nr:carbamoyltransferase HypF [Flavobacterium hungaricum]
MNPSFQILISGSVQGVGFRPFVYNLAVQLRLRGFVTNNESGVLIIVQENEKTANNFFNELKRKHPKNAKINSIKISEIVTEEKFDTFFIKPTAENTLINAPLTPDFRTCKNCREEILDPENPRYFYPFVSCTSCGPRYAIAEKFPFERENTSMSEFKMCDNCLEEYYDPKNIRFHSQTNSCPNCGPQIKFTDNTGFVFSGTNKEIFETLCQKLKEGKIIAVKNTSGYLLLCDATNAVTVQELRNRKKRLTKPFAVLFQDIKQIETYLLCHQSEKNLLKSALAPIVILPQKKQLDLAAAQIAPNMKTIGAMLPNSGLLHLITTLFQKPLIATSANFNGSSIFANEEEAVKTLNPIADYYLHHNLEILNSQDDSVIRLSRKNKQKIILRHARGYAPNLNFPFLEKTPEKLLCLGAALKNTITITPNQQVYMSEYIGSLLNFDTYNRFEKKIANYQRFFDFSPQTILYDQHPNYENNKVVTEFTKENKTVKTLKIQHHEAHFAAILSEKKLWKKSKILGVIWDGSGFGSETEIYGGEFFEYDHKIINRIGHLEYFSWILGDQMAQNPKIAALSISRNNSFFHPYFNKNELKIYSKYIKNSSIKTSSMGRLIDAAAFILGFHKPILFEGEAAIYLENLAQQAFCKSNIKVKDYLKDENATAIIPCKKLLFQIIKAAKTQADPQTIALNFHYTLVKCIERAACSSKSKEIAFSGGVFQNSVLVDLIIDHLKPKFKLHFHEMLSPNDENISFGQLNHYLNLKK